MSEADLTPEQIARALAGLRRGAWTHHDVVDGREVMVDRTDDMARLAAAVERLTEPAMSDADLVMRLGQTETALRWDTDEIPLADLLADARHAIERLTVERDEARKEARQLRNTMQLHAGDVTSATLEADREHERAEAAEARVTLLERALRPFAELGRMAIEMNEDNHFGDDESLGHVICDEGCVTVGMAKRAFTALTPSPAPVPDAENAPPPVREAGQ